VIPFRISQYAIGKMNVSDVARFQELCAASQVSQIAFEFLVDVWYQLELLKILHVHVLYIDTYTLYTDGNIRENP